MHGKTSYVSDQDTVGDYDGVPGRLCLVHTDDLPPDSNPRPVARNLPGCPKPSRMRFLVGTSHRRPRRDKQEGQLALTPRPTSGKPHEFSGPTGRRITLGCCCDMQGANRPRANELRANRARGNRLPRQPNRKNRSPLSPKQPLPLQIRGSTALANSWLHYRRLLPLKFVTSHIKISRPKTGFLMPSQR